LPISRENRSITMSDREDCCAPNHQVFLTLAAADPSVKKTGRFAAGK
jgi:hypothetical protein